MSQADRSGERPLRGIRGSRSDRIKADTTITEQLRGAAVPGHRDFVRPHRERTSPAVIGSSLPKSVRRLLNLS